MKPVIRLLGALCVWGIASIFFEISFAQQPPPAAAIQQSKDTVRAQEMLDRAVAHYRKNGKQALAAFSRAVFTSLAAA